MHLPSRGGGGRASRVRPDVNVTPLVDVVLVLLIIFMVITPMLQRNKDVVLPRATHIDERTKEEDPLTISITHDERLWIGAREVTLPDIGKEVKALIKDSPGRRVLIKGDERVHIKQVRLVMHEVQEAGAKAVGLGVDVPEGDEP